MVDRRKSLTKSSLGAILPETGKNVRHGDKFPEYPIFFKNRKIFSGFYALYMVLQLIFGAAEPGLRGALPVPPVNGKGLIKK